jgi:hypothetical protein
MNMKKLLFIPFWAIMLLLMSCTADEIELFDSNNYIYFNVSKETDADYPVLSYTFTYQDASLKDTIYEIPVKFLGRYLDKNAQFEWKIVDSLTTAKADVHYRILDADKQFIPEKMSDGSAKIQLLRSDDMKTKSYSLVLQLVENKNFKVGPADLIKINISDQLVKPDWWTSIPYVKFLGTYSPTKLLLWFEFTGVKNGSNPFDTDKYVYWTDRGTGNYIYKNYRDSEIRYTTMAFRNWLRNDKNNPYDEDLKKPVSESLGSY